VQHLDSVAHLADSNRVNARTPEAHTDGRTVPATETPQDAIDPAGLG